MLRQAATMARLRVEHALFNSPARDEIASLEARHDVDLSHLYD